MSSLWAIRKAEKHAKHLFNSKFGIKPILEISDSKVDINLNIMILGFYHKTTKNTALISKHNCLYFIYSVQRYMMKCRLLDEQCQGKIIQYKNVNIQANKAQASVSKW